MVWLYLFESYLYAGAAGLPPSHRLRRPRETLRARIAGPYSAERVVVCTKRIRPDGAAGLKPSARIARPFRAHVWLYIQNEYVPMWAVSRTAALRLHVRKRIRPL